MNRTCVIWDEDSGGFVESIGHAGIFKTERIDSAYQYTDEESAFHAAELLDNAVVLRWL